MKTGIDLSARYPFPPERVWAALTSSGALATWLMPNDFAPVKGHRFTFRTKPAPGFDGIVHCEVMELDPPRRMVWHWAGGPLDTTVTFTLEPTADGTHLRLQHEGFHGLAAQLVRRIMGNGWPRLLRRHLGEWLANQAP